MEIIRTIKGTNDLLPGESFRWQFAEALIRSQSSRFGFREIRTPIFESTALFSRGIGELTDIVSKEMYTFPDRGGNSLTLRPEMTASVMRSFIQHRLDQDGGVQKLFYIGPMFRAENVQKGRLRQFHQWGVECVSAEGPAADAEVIALMIRTLAAFGLTNLTLRINSVGDEQCRPVYREALRTFFTPVKDQLCPTCQGRLENNPMRILDCKSQVCQTLAKGAPSILDYLNEDCRTHFETLQSLLNALNIAYVIDDRLVRGLDYYTKTAFEVTSNDLGSQNAVGGGGRYDLLVSQLGGKPTPSVGFAIGLERLFIILEELKLNPGWVAPVPDLYIALLDREARMAAASVIDTLRTEGLSVEYDLMNRSLKAQLREADRLGSRFVVVIGSQELSSGQFRLKNMQTGTEQVLPVQEWVQAIRREK
ncbi:MAG: histidine--tRNA ligase [Bacteroidetes bacterium]|nr:histidine--tRNA ligase [Bacteroidota bacterium]